MVPSRTFSIHGIFLLNKRFFIVEKLMLQIIKMIFTHLLEALFLIRAQKRTAGISGVQLKLLRSVRLRLRLKSHLAPLIVTELSPASALATPFHSWHWSSTILCSSRQRLQIFLTLQTPLDFSRETDTCVTHENQHLTSFLQWLSCCESKTNTRPKRKSRARSVSWNKRLGLCSKPLQHLNVDTSNQPIRAAVMYAVSFGPFTLGETSETFELMLRRH